MTAISFNNPYAPQPVAQGNDVSVAAVQPTAAVKDTSSGSQMGSASDQSGQGAGNGTGTGGAQLATLLARGREDLELQQPTPKSIVEAQSEADPASAFLERQAQQRFEAKAEAEARAASIAAERAAQAKAEAAEAAKPEFELPNPLPTAPILQRDDS